MSALLAVDGLNKVYHRNSLFESTDRSVHAVRDVSFSVRQGEILGIVGESGCGKSTLARAVFFLERPTSGTVRFRGVDVSSMRGAELLRFRKHAQVVFQDPHGALNPRLRVGRSLEEGLIAQRVARARRRDRVRELMEVVGLDEHYLTAYPHELSGGQRQRVVIARALAL
ncbi:MAG: ATP-binding cassette domain-containing protein, partial [Spirochaetota bacterium]